MGSEQDPFSLTLGGQPFRCTTVEDSIRQRTQDAKRVGVDFVGVADGASPLGPMRAGEPGEFAADALRALEDHRSPDAEQMFDLALRQMARSGTSIDPADALSCTVGLVYLVDAGAVAATVLGDCTIVIRRAGKPDIMVTDRRLAARDRAATNALAAELGKHGDQEAAFKAVLPMLRKHRAESNTPGSYWVVSGDPRAAAETVSQRVALSEIQAILLYTDGFERLIEPFALADSPSQLIRSAEAHGLANLLGRLRGKENMPDSLVRYPRLSKSDDVTAILLERES